MSGERLIRIIEDVILEDGCTIAWDFNPLGDETGLPYYVCRKHNNAKVPLEGPCPRSEIWARKGETVSVPAKVASRLVESELAEYPTHAPEIDQGIQETVDRVNSLLEAEGLPHTDLEAMGVVKVQGRQSPYERTARPTDRRLAGDLGIEADDIAEMRKLAGGS